MTRGQLLREYGKKFMNNAAVFVVCIFLTLQVLLFRWECLASAAWKKRLTRFLVFAGDSFATEAAMAFLRRLRRKPRADTAGTGSALLPAKKKKRIWHSYETDNCKKRALQSNASFTAALSGVHAICIGLLLLTLRPYCPRKIMQMYSLLEKDRRIWWYLGGNAMDVRKLSLPIRLECAQKIAIQLWCVQSQNVPLSSFWSQGTFLWSTKISFLEAQHLKISHFTT